MCRGAQAAHPNPTPGGPGLVTLRLKTAPPFEQAAARQPRLMQALGWSGQRPGTGTGGGSGPPNCGGTTTRRPDPERSEPSVSDWTANYIGRGRKPARGPLPQDGKRGCRGGARREQVHTSRGPIRGPNEYPHHQATTWPKGLGKRSGSRSDGLEACSPGEGREPPRSLDGRGRVTGSLKYDSDHS